MQKKFFYLLQKSKKPLHLHPLLQGIFEGMRSRGRGEGEKKVGPGLGGEEKMITFAAAQREAGLKWWRGVIRGAGKKSKKFSVRELEEKKKGLPLQPDPEGAVEMMNGMRAQRGAARYTEVL